MDIVNKNKFILSTFVMGFVALMNASIPTMVWFIYLKDESNNSGITDTAYPNYHRAWRSLWLGSLIGFIPTVLLWIPSYFSKTATRVYVGTWEWANKSMVF